MCIRDRDYDFSGYCYEAASTFQYLRFTVREDLNEKEEIRGKF